MTVPYPAALTWLGDLTLLLMLSLSVSLSRFPTCWIYLSQTFRRVPKIVLRSFRTNDMKGEPHLQSVAGFHLCIFVKNTVVTFTAEEFKLCFLVVFFFWKSKTGKCCFLSYLMYNVKGQGLHIPRTFPVRNPLL